MKNLLSLFLLTTFLACGSETTDTTPLHGQWQGIEWLVNGQASGRNIEAVSFEFKADGSYTASLGQQTETGTYYLSGDQLYTTGEGQIEKMVKVALPHPDTLSMDMNRVGTPEVIVLVRK